MKKPPDGDRNDRRTALDCRQQFIQFPDMIRDASGHRRGDPRSAVDAAEGVMGNVQRHREVFLFLFATFAPSR
jgi:hypothetical protein